MRWVGFAFLAVAALLAAVAATVIAVAVNVATGGTSPWLPSVETRPLWWVVGGTAAVAVAGVLMWWAQRQADRRLDELVPAALRIEPWVVDRPLEVGRVVRALRRRRGAVVGITTAVQGAGGFGKTTVARLVRTDRRILRRFRNRVYWVTLGRDVRTGGAIATKVNDLIARIDPDRPVAFADPLQAGEHLAALLAAGPRRLLILDDVWYPEQETAFPVGGRGSARLLTTRIASVIKGESVPVRVDEVTAAQAEALLTYDLPPMSRSLVDALMAETGRWPLLLRLVNKVLCDQAKAAPDVGEAARDLLTRLRRSGALHVDELTGAAAQRLDINDPVQRQHAVTATIEASTDLLTSPERSRFAELAIFAEDETVPVDLIADLWHGTAALDVLQTRALCARLDELALITLTEGRVSIHDVIRDFLLAEMGAERGTALHHVLVRAVAEHLPSADALVPDVACPEVAWWQLDVSARYLWDHLVEHLIAAGWTTEAEALAEDLRWTTERLVHSGPQAVHADLSLVETPRCRSLRRLVGQSAHLLTPTEPPRARADVLFSRISHDPHWRAAADALDEHRPRLTNRWPLPDLAHPAQRWTARAGSYEGAVAIAPNGSWIAVANRSATTVFDTVRWTEVATLAGHTRSVQGIAVAPDGTWLVTTGQDSTMRIWDTATWTEKSVHGIWKQTLRCPAVAPNGKWLAVPAGSAVRIWDTTTWTETAVLSHYDADADADSPREVFAIAIAADGDWLAACDSGGTVRTWSARTWVKITSFRHSGASLRTVAIAPNGAWLASAGGMGGTIRLWNMRDRTQQATLAGHTGLVRGIAFAPNGTWLASCGADRVVRIWDVRRRIEIRTIDTGHVNWINTLAIAPDGTWLATVGADDTVRAWDTSTKHEVDRDDHRARNVKTLVAWRDRLASSHEDEADRHLVRFWDVRSGAELTEFVKPEVPGELTYSASKLAVSADGSALATVDSSRVLAWSAIGKPRRVDRPRWTLQHTSAVGAVAVAPSGAWIASGSGWTVRIWHAAAGSLLVTFVHKARFALLSEVKGVVVAPDGAWLATSRGRSIRIWDTSTWTPLRELSARSPAVQWPSLTVAPDGTWLASADFPHGDWRVRIWDTETWELRAVRLVGETGKVVATAVSPDRRWIATIVGGALRIWEAATGLPVAAMRVEHAASTCAWTTDGRSIGVGGRAGLYLFDFHPVRD